MDPEASLPLPHEPARGSYLEPEESSPDPHIPFFKFNLNVKFPSIARSLNFLLQFSVHRLNTKFLFPKFKDE
jgi:hypothetical protein